MTGNADFFPRSGKGLHLEVKKWGTSVGTASFPSEMVCWETSEPHQGCHGLLFEAQEEGEIYLRIQQFCAGLIEGEFLCCSPVVAVSRVPLELLDPSGLRTSPRAGSSGARSCDYLKLRPQPGFSR